MSTMASARVPAEIYSQGVEKLAEIGSNTTELIVSAFSYVAKAGELPNYAKEKPAAKRITADQLAEFQRKFEGSCLHLSLPEDWDFKQELAEGKWADYEALA